MECLGIKSIVLITIWYMIDPKFFDIGAKPTGEKLPAD